MSAGVSEGLTTVTRAPASTSPATFRSAIVAAADDETRAGP